MPDLDYRFDDYTEKYQSRQLAEVREYTRTHVLPDAITMEIGSNRGRFIEAMARRHPERFFLGVEIRAKYVKKARRALGRAGITNADIVCSDVNLVLPILIDDGQISDVFVLYPDPWWKSRHEKRRVIQPEFLDRLAPKMQDGGGIWIRTDVGPLADDMRDVLMAHPAFAPLAPEEYPPTPFARSTRERDWTAKGNPIHLVYFRRA